MPIIHLEKYIENSDNRRHGLEEWCRLKKIKLQRIPPRVKELNGKVERSHRIDADYFYGRAPTKNLEVFNKALESQIRSYNIERSHGGLGYMTSLEKLKECIESFSRQCFLGAAEESMRREFVKSIKIIDNYDVSEKTAA